MENQTVVELTIDNEVFIPTDKAADLTGLYPRQVQNLCKSGKFKAIKLNGNWWVLKEHAENYERTNRGLWRRQDQDQN